MKSEYLPIKKLPQSERPYEKFISKGPGALTDAELLAVIIKTGNKNLRATDLAVQVLDRFCKSKGLQELNRLSLEELITINGIGKVKAIQLLCAAELSKRIRLSDSQNRPVLDTPEKIALEYMDRMRWLSVEHCYAVMLDSKNRFIKDELIAKGTINRAMMPPREILVSALKCDAAAIVLLHNHPSGDPTPSSEDYKATDYVRKACIATGIELLDHIIIGENRYSSIKELGRIN